MKQLLPLITIINRVNPVNTPDNYKLILNFVIIITIIITIITYFFFLYTILQVNPDSIAGKAGLRSRDIVLAINGIVLKNCNLQGAMDIIRNSPGTLQLQLKLFVFITSCLYSSNLLMLGSAIRFDLVCFIAFVSFYFGSSFLTNKQI